MRSSALAKRLASVVVRAWVLVAVRLTMVIGVMIQPETPLELLIVLLAQAQLPLVTLDLGILGVIEWAFAIAVIIGIDRLLNTGLRYSSLDDPREE